MRSKLFFLLTVLFSFLLQSTVIEKIAIGSVTPNLLIILCVSMGLMRGRKSGMWTGFFAGFLVDIFYGKVFGVYALIYMYVGFFAGYGHRLCYDDDIRVPVLLTALGDLLYNIGVYALQFLLRGRLGLRIYISRIILPEICYTALLAFLIYRIYRFINYHLMEPVRRKKESVWVIKS